MGSRIGSRPGGLQVRVEQGECGKGKAREYSRRSKSGLLVAREAAVKAHEGLVLQSVKLA